MHDINYEVSKINELTHSSHVHDDFGLTGIDFRNSSTPDTASNHLPDVSLFTAAPIRPTDNSINGRNPPGPAELESSRHIVDLVEANAFQNAKGSLTAAATEAIRSAIVDGCGRFQTYESRTRQVQNYVNSRIMPGVALTYDRDAANSTTRLGSQPFIRATIDGRTVRIPTR